MLKTIRSSWRRRWLPALCAGFALAPAAPALAVELIGVSRADGLVYDVDAQSGAASNPRTLSAPSPCTQAACLASFINLSLFVGAEVDTAGELLVATSETFPDYPSTIFTTPLDPPSDFVSSGFAAGEQFGEGGLALDPISGDLFAVGLTDLIAPFTLLRIDLTPPPPDPITAVVVGEIGFSDISALAFDAAGTLYALDTDADTLLELDPSDASTLSTTPLSVALGALAGMDIDPTTDTVYVADGGAGGTNTLYTLDLTTAVLDAIGPLGIASGLSGLAVPEPGAALLGFAACAALAGVASRRR